MTLQVSYAFPETFLSSYLLSKHHTDSFSYPALIFCLILLDFDDRIFACHRATRRRSLRISPSSPVVSSSFHPIRRCCILLKTSLALLVNNNFRPIVYSAQCIVSMSTFALQFPLFLLLIYLLSRVAWACSVYWPINACFISRLFRSLILAIVVS